VYTRVHVRLLVVYRRVRRNDSRCVDWLECTNDRRRVSVKRC